MLWIFMMFLALMTLTTLTPLQYLRPYQISYQDGDIGTQPGNDALHHDHEQGPAATQFAADGGDGGHAGRIEQAEHQQTEDYNGRE